MKFSKFTNSTLKKVESLSEPIIDEIDEIEQVIEPVIEKVEVTVLNIQELLKKVNPDELNKVLKSMIEEVEQPKEPESE